MFQILDNRNGSGARLKRIICKIAIKNVIHLRVRVDLGGSIDRPAPHFASSCNLICKLSEPESRDSVPECKTEEVGNPWHAEKLFTIVRLRIISQ